MKNILLSVLILFLSSCSFSIADEIEIKCCFEVKSQLDYNQTIQVMKNGFKLGSITGIHQVNMTGVVKTYGVMHLPRKHCYYKNSTFGLYKVDNDKDNSIVIADFLDKKGPCLNSGDTVLIKDYTPPSINLFSIDSVNAKLLDSTINGLIHKH